MSRHDPYHAERAHQIVRSFRLLHSLVNELSQRSQASVVNSRHPYTGYFWRLGSNVMTNVLSSHVRRNLESECHLAISLHNEEVHYYGETMSAHRATVDSTGVSCRVPHSAQEPSYT